MMRKSALHTVLALTIILVVTHVTDAKTKLTVMDWYSAVQHTAVRQVFDQYEASHPDVEIDYMTISWSHFPEKVSIMSAAGTPPDILCGTGPNIAQFYELGLIKNLYPLMERDGITFNGWFGRTFPASGKSVQNMPPIGEKSNYAVPYGGVFRVNFYNIDMYRTAGLPLPPMKFGENPNWTWEYLFRDYARKLTRDIDGDGKLDYYGIYTMQIFDYYPLHFGGTWISEDGMRFTGVELPVIDTLNYLYGLQMVDKVVGGSWAAGKSAMASDNLTAAITYAKATGVFDWSASLIPSGRTGALIPGGFDAFWMMKDSKNTEAAWELIKYLSSPGTKQYVVDALGLLPTQVNPTVRRNYVTSMTKKGVPSSVSEEFTYIARMALN